MNNNLFPNSNVLVYSFLFWDRIDFSTLISLGEKSINPDIVFHNRIWKVEELYPQISCRVEPFPWE